MSEISDYLNDLFSGRKPIRRENPKPGQSGWYYMMPKSDDDYTDYDFIDVPDENTPNPRLAPKPVLGMSSLPPKEPEQPQMSIPLLPTQKPAIPYGMSELNQLSELDAFNMLKKQLFGFEEPVEYPYLDTKGNITYGVGHMDNSLAGFKTHPWINKNSKQPANQDEIAQNYDLIKRQKYGQNIPSEYFKNKTDLNLSNDYMDNLFNNDITSRWNELKNNMSGFEQLDPQAQAAILETHYTANVLPWQNLKQAVNNQEYLNICKELHRKEQGRRDMPKRNEWAYKQCMAGLFK